MRKILKVAVLTFLVVVAGGWCVTWYVQANESKKAIEKFAATVNANKPYIAYDSLETSGFPTHVTLTLTNPRFSGRMDELLQQINLQKTSPDKPMPEWNAELRLDGTMSITVNSLSDHYQLDLNGKWVHNGSVAGQSVISLTNHEPASMSCSLVMSSGSFYSNMWNFKLFEDFKHFAEDFREIDCRSSSYAMVDSTGGNVVMSSGPSQFFISSNPENSHNNVRLYAKYNDMQITSEGDKIISTYVHALMPDSFYPELYAYYGKQNMEVDLAFKGPSFSAPHTDVEPFEFNLSKFDISNSLYSGSGHLLAKNEMTDADNVAATLDTKFEFTYTPHYDDLIKNVVYSFIQHAYKTNDPMFANFKESLSVRTPEQTYAMIAPAIPNFSQLGTWLQTINLSYAGSKNFTNGNVNLSDFALSATPYGVSGNGSAKIVPGNPFPEAHFNFVCSSCTRLIDDLSGYINRVSDVVKTFYPEDPTYNFKVSEQLVAGIKTFLGTLSTSKPEETANGHFTFVIASDQSGSMTIGGRNLVDVMALYQQHIGNQLMPSAGGAHPQGDIPTQGWKVE